MLSLALAAGAAAPLAAHAGASPYSIESQKPKPDKPKPEKAQKAKPGKQEKAAAKQNGRADADVVRVFDRDGHTRVIRDYSRSGLPPGLAKREALPPGLRKQIRERGTLPPGLDKRFIDVPADWATRLPALNRYERRYFVGDDLIVIDTRTNTIVAYLADVLR
jgi:hypothetical protein